MEDERGEGGEEEEKRSAGAEFFTRSKGDFWTMIDRGVGMMDRRNGGVVGSKGDR